MTEFESILHYFPSLTTQQVDQFRQLQYLYDDWNAKINVISRKDIDGLYLKHVLHSLGIAKVISFEPGTKVLDVGTGGGFPGIPLAILFPEVHFHLVDSIGKKIKVVEEVAKALGLTNVTAAHCRVEEVKDKYDFIVSRAVTEMNTFYNWVKRKVLPDSFNSLTNGILYLKGGDLSQELGPFKSRYNLYPLSAYFTDPFFETKVVVHLKLKYVV